MSQEKDLLTDLGENGVTASDIVWTLLCKGKITLEQATKFHMNDITLEQLVKEIKK